MVYMLNSIGGRTEPGGTPFFIVLSLLPVILPVIDWRDIELLLRSEIFGKRKVFRQFDKYFSALYIT